MRHFNFLSKKQEEAIFFQAPQIIKTKHRNDYHQYTEAERQLIGHSLGAALYMPGTREDIAKNIISARYSAAAYVLCLEDSIGDVSVELAEQNLIEQLQQLELFIAQLSEEEQSSFPMLFVRVRTPEHLSSFSKKMSSLIKVIDGFALPKADNRNMAAYLENLIQVSEENQTWLWAMPILESRELMSKRSREEELNKVFEVLTKPEFEERILNIRLGATDMCGLFGLRRTIDSTIYDVSVMKDFMTDVLNYFALDRRFVVSGCVWEFFTKRPRMMKPLLRETPFKVKLGEDGQQIRKELITDANDGLIREVMLDKVNGINGKTCIHPTHIVPINSQLVVPKEEYFDAKHICESKNGQVGVFKSDQGNKMNEVKPHLLWAKQVLLRAQIYGVFNDKKEFVDLLIAEYLSEEST
ncbi:HpcH/HpaI aldolase/citrate lyase family protein [Enterococcus sp. LJL128]|uniref:HpcH/HpaI aldolase/citrate lyase family protein n=1 Tax=Enterococcus sp. LJL51 TaxID=3416656 RepID=UPI003CF7099D